MLYWYAAVKDERKRIYIPLTGPYDSQEEERAIQAEIAQTAQYPIGHIHNPERRAGTIIHNSQTIKAEVRMVYGYGTIRHDTEIDLYLDASRPTDKEQEDIIIAAALRPLKRSHGDNAIGRAHLQTYWTSPA